MANRELFESLESRQLLTTFTVLNLNDAGAGSLRDAVASANGAAGADIIDFAPGLTGVIQLSSADLYNNSDLAINGPGAGLLSVNANGAFGVFDLDTGSVLSIDGLTISGGGGIARGGGIYNSGTLILNNVVVSNNTSTADSGGIFNSGTLTITNSTISNNTAATLGGGIYNAAGTMTISGTSIFGNSASSGGAINNTGTVNIVGCGISSNTGTGFGGGIFTFGTATISNSTISANHGSAGGGIYNALQLLVENSTLTANTASAGGGLFADAGTVTVRNSTIAGNLAGGGIDIDAATLTLISSIVSANTSGDVSGTLNAGSTNNLVKDAATAGGLTNGVNANIVGVDPLLGPLANNGGATLTMAILAGSPAINKGINPGAFTIDQRGAFGRVRGTGIDIGAFEFSAPPAITSLTASALAFTRPLPLTLTAVATDPDDAVSSVMFYQDLNNNGVPDTGELLGTDANGNDGFTFIINNTLSLPAGTVHFLAIGVDNDGLATANANAGTATVNIFNTLPTLTGLTPSAATFAQGDALTLTATGAADTDGSVTAVRFYADANNDGIADPGELLGTDSNAGDGFSLTLSGTQTNALAAGTVNFIAFAVDNDSQDSAAATSSATALFNVHAGTGKLVSGTADAADNSRVVSVNPNGHVLVFEQGWTVADLQAKTAAPNATGDAVIWVDPKDNLVYVAAPSDSGLLLFTRGSNGAWSFRNLTTETAAAFSPTHGLTQFTSVGNIVVIAGITNAGDIVGFQQTLQTAAGGGPAFKFIDISGDLTSQGMTTPAITSLISYVPSWDSWHLAGVDNAGKIQSVWIALSSFTKWRTDDLSAITGGPAAAGQLAVTLTTWGGINLSALNNAGHLLTTWWVPSFGGVWQINDLTDEFGGTPLSGGKVSGYTTPWGGLNYVGLAADGTVTVYWWVPSLAGWSVSPLLPDSIPADRTTGTLTSSSSPAGTLSVYGTAANGDALRMWWKPSGSATWAVDDVSALATRS